MDNVVLYSVFLNIINLLKEKRINRSRVIKGEDISSPHHPQYHELWESDTYHYNTIGNMIGDSGWKLNACLQHNVVCGCDNQKEFLDFLNIYDPEDDYIMKKNNKITRFLYKYLNKETKGCIYSLDSLSKRNKPILNKNTTVIAFEGEGGFSENKSWVFCRIDTPYNEKLVSLEDSYKFRHNGKYMIYFFIIIDTQLDRDKDHRNQCIWSIDTVNVCLERALPLVPKAFTDNYY
jgi:hypothetical protein